MEMPILDIMELPKTKKSVKCEIDSIGESVKSPGLYAPAVFSQWLAEALEGERMEFYAELERRHLLLLHECVCHFDKDVTVLPVDMKVTEAKKQQTGTISGEAAPTRTIHLQENPVIHEFNVAEGAESTQISVVTPDSSTQTGTSRKTGGATSSLVNRLGQHTFILHEISGMRSRPKTRLYKLVTRKEFEVFIAMVICVNTVVVALETQYQGIGICYGLQYHLCTQKAEDLWPSAESVFQVLEWFFGLFFACEMVIKIVGLQHLFFADWWNYFDSAVVVIGLVELMSTGLGDAFESFLCLRLLRLARVMRIFRVIRSVNGFDSLFLMVTSLKTCIPVLFWAIVILLLWQTLFAFAINAYLVEDVLEDVTVSVEKRQELYKYFGTFSRSLFSMFELTFGNWVVIARLLLEDVSQFFMIFNLLHKLSMGFAVIGVINATFIQETFKVAASDDHVMLLQRERAIRTHTHKMKEFFRKADKSGDGRLSRQEFADIMEKDQVRNWLAAQDLVASDVDSLFVLLDTGDGMLEAEELVIGVSRLKGPARSFDMELVKRDQEEMRLMIDNIHTALHLKSPKRAYQKQFDDGNVFSPEFGIHNRPRAPHILSSSPTFCEASC
jgi:hypothetical protein